MGFSVESGGVWDDRDDIGFEDMRLGGSVFIGVKTFVGPLYIGYGLAEGQSSEGRLYTFLGKTF